MPLMRSICLLHRFNRRVVTIHRNELIPRRLDLLPIRHCSPTCLLASIITIIIICPLQSTIIPCSSPIQVWLDRSSVSTYVHISLSLSFSQLILIVISFNLLFLFVSMALFLNDHLYVFVHSLSLGCLTRDCSVEKPTRDITVHWTRECLGWMGD